MKYKCRVEEVSVSYVNVEAESVEEACEAAEAARVQGEVEFSHLEEVDISVVP